MALKQLQLGAPSLLGKAADEALGLFGSAFPLTLDLSNQTPSAHQFHVPDFRVGASQTVPVTFESESALRKFVNNAQQVGFLAGFSDAFVLSDQASGGSAETKGKKGSKKVADVEAAGDQATEQAEDDGQNEAGSE